MQYHNFNKKNTQPTSFLLHCRKQHLYFMSHKLQFLQTLTKQFKNFVLRFYLFIYYFFMLHAL